MATRNSYYVVAHATNYRPGHIKITAWHELIVIKWGESGRYVLNGITTPMRMGWEPKRTSLRNSGFDAFKLETRLNANLYSV